MGPHNRRNWKRGIIMKKNMKSVLSMILALCMVACMAVPAFAENDIIIYNDANGGPSVAEPEKPKVNTGTEIQIGDNYNYVELKGNTGKYNYIPSMYTDFNLNYEDALADPIKGRVELKLTGIYHDVNGLEFSIRIANGLNQTFSVKRLDNLLILKDGEVIAKVPHQLPNKSVTISANSIGYVDGLIKPEYFDHNARLRSPGDNYSVEATLICE